MSYHFCHNDAVIVTVIFLATRHEAHDLPWFNVSVSVCASVCVWLGCRYMCIEGRRREWKRERGIKKKREGYKEKKEKDAE